MSGRYYLWSNIQTEAFIKMRKENEELFSGKRNSASSAWNIVIKALALDGQVTVNQCRKKWDNLVRKYKDLRNPSTGSGREGGVECADTWPLYNIMHWAIGERDAVSPPCLFDSHYGSMPSPGGSSLEEQSDRSEASESPGPSVRKRTTSEASTSPAPLKRKKTDNEALERVVALLEKAIANQQERGEEMLKLMRQLVEKK